MVDPGNIAVLDCPLPINDIDLGGITNDNDMSKYRVHYIDPDGTGSAAKVTVYLHRTKVTNGTVTVTGFCPFQSSPNTALATTTIVPCVQDLAAGTFYSFQVILQVSGSSVLGGSFVGIDFPP
jgi:hypothetical protein